MQASLQCFQAWIWFQVLFIHMTCRWRLYIALVVVIGSSTHFRKSCLTFWHRLVECGGLLLSHLQVYGWIDPKPESAIACALIATLQRNGQHQHHPSRIWQNYFMRYSSVPGNTIHLPMSSHICWYHHRGSLFG